MDVGTVVAIIGIIITVLAFLGGIFVGIVKILQVIDRNTMAIDGLHGTVKAQWGRIDEHGEMLDEHGRKIVKLETRLDYHEEKVHAR